MSTALERLFSLANITILDRRNQIYSKTTEAIKCLKSWRRSPDFNLQQGVEDMGGFQG